MKADLDLNIIGLVILGLVALTVLFLLYMGLSSGGNTILDSIKSIFL